MDVRAEQGADLSRRHVALADVNAVGARGGNEGGAVVEDQAERRHGLADDEGIFKENIVGITLIAVLEKSDAGVCQLTGESVEQGAAGE